MRRALPWLAAGCLALGLGAWLWGRFGLQVWLEQAIAFCL